MTDQTNTDVNETGSISGSEPVYSRKAETLEGGTPPPDKPSGTESDPPKRRQKVIIRWRKKKPIVDPQAGEQA